MKRRLLFVFAAIAVFATTASAQQRGGGAGQTAAAAPLVRTASISGQVVDADSAAPIGGAVVRLQSRLLAAAAGNGGRAALPPGAGSPQPAPPPGTDAVISDSDGRFVFHDLPKGATQLTASASGYLDRAAMPPGAAPAQRPIQLEDGQHLDGVRLRLSKVASVSGVVLDEAGEPVVGLVVNVLRREVPQGIPRLTVSGFTTTDDRGLYRLDNLPPGQLYVLAPQNITTIPVSEADKQAGSMLAANPLIEAMTGGTQTSMVMAGIRVGDQMIRTAGGGLGAPGNSPPPPVNGRFAAYQTTFYPGVTQLSQAIAITLRSGDERTGVDFQIRPTASARVSGLLMTKNGPAASMTIRLVPAPGHAEDEALTVATATTGPDGAFTFVGVPTGQYVAEAQISARQGTTVPADVLATMTPEMRAAAQARATSSESAFLQAPVTVGDRDITGLSFVLKPGAKVGGLVVFDGAAPKPTPQQMANVQVAFVSQFGQFSNPQTRLNADATFKTPGYAPGQYTASAIGAPAPWLLRSVKVDGRDVMTSGIEIGESDLDGVELTFIDRPATVSGFVRQEGNGPLPGVTALLISADYRASIAAGMTPRQQTAIVQPTGAFAFGRLLPGDYFVVAVLDEAVPVQRELPFYDAFARVGTRVTIAEGETKTLDLKIVRSIR